MTPYRERTRVAGFDSLGNLADSARVVAIADSTMGVSADMSRGYETASFTRDPRGFLIARQPGDRSTLGGGGLVWVGRDGDALVIYRYQ